MNDTTIVQTMLKDEARFLHTAERQDMLAVVRYFNDQARHAETPQERDFYQDRAYQFALYA